MLTSHSDTSRFAVQYVTVLTADPAANAEISFTVPAGVTYELQSCFVQLVTDATVANRQIDLVLDDGTNTIGRFPLGAAVTASLTTRLTWAPNLITSTAIVNTDLVAAIPSPLVLPAGFRVQTATLNRAAGDNYGPMTLMVARYS